MKKLKLLSSLSTFLFAVAVVASEWGCLFIFHQPKVPAGIKALRKI